MKAKLFLTGIVLSSLVFLPVLQAGAQGSEKRKLDAFTSLVTNGVVNVTLFQGDSSSVTIECEKGPVTSIITKVSGGKLEVSNGEEKSKCRVLVVMKEIKSLEANGATTIKGSGPLSVGDLMVNSSGASKIKVEVKAGNVSVNISGASDIRLSGSAAVLTAELTGASSLRAAKMETGSGKVQVSGSSYASVNVKEKLSVDASGASSVQYVKAPKDIMINVSGVSSVTPFEDDKITMYDSTGKKVLKHKVIIIDDEKKKHGHMEHLEKEMENLEKDMKKMEKEIEEQVEKELEQYHKHKDQHHKDKEKYYKDKEKHYEYKYKHHKGDKRFFQRHREFKWRRGQFYHHWSGIEFGVNGYLDFENNISLPQNLQSMDLDYSKSFNLNINAFEHDFNIWKNRLNVVTGIGASWNGYAFRHAVTLNADSSFTTTFTDSISYERNRLNISSITLPFLLEMNTSSRPSRSIHIAAGVLFNYVFRARTAQSFERDGYQFNINRRDDYNLNPFLYSATVRAGYGAITLYGTYALNGLFERNKGPQLYPFSLGIRVIPF